MRNPDSGDALEGAVEVGGGLLTVYRPVRVVGADRYPLGLEALTWPSRRVRSILWQSLEERT
ncbi:hypothetical protein [Conexibacter sp. DBS9H8]|uniref:hypothetical protein n=1 Tax=Conexibacter sp. DBS9H8 TaxID=2937801 RepID=UPI00200F64B0|nr:hypothetical protein [Conexibacter sp. DBS9H8]